MTFREEGASPPRADCVARSANQLWATKLQDLGGQTDAATTQEAKRSVSQQHRKQLVRIRVNSRLKNFAAKEIAAPQ